AITPLQLLADRRSDLAAQVTRMKEIIVDGVERPTGGPANQLAVGNLKLDTFPGELQWTGTLSGLDTSKDTVSTQWYHQDQQHLGWSAIGAVSGVITPQTDTNAGTDAYFVKVNYLNTGRCLDPGRYRVEVYVDGRLSGRAESDAEFGALDAANLRDLGTAVCHPAGW